MTRLYAPATLRNREPILDVLRDVLAGCRLVLEVASGSGEHVVHFAQGLPDVVFQPSDPSGEALESVAAWIGEACTGNVRPPLRLDAAEAVWPIARADAVLCINMVHIAPWEATAGLMKGAAAVLPSGAPLYLYGPYRRPDIALAPSNAEFDRSLREQNPAWGLRNLDEVSRLAASAGFSKPEVIEMPANNLSVVFRRT